MTEMTHFTSSGVSTTGTVAFRSALTALMVPSNGVSSTRLSQANNDVAASCSAPVPSAGVTSLDLPYR
jgi:hypothetical protein